MSVCTVSFVAARGRVAKRVLCLHSILRRSPGVSRSGCCVCTVSLVAARGRVAKRVLCLHSILRRSPVVSGGGIVFAHYLSSQSGRVAKRVLCLHSILRRSPVVSRSGCCVCTVSFVAVRSSREAGAVFAQYPSIDEDPRR